MVKLTGITERSANGSDKRSAYPLFRKSDILWLLFCFALAAAPWLVNLSAKPAQAGVAKIYYRKQLVQEIQLARAKVGDFTIDEVASFTFHIDQEHQISILEAPCPDQICRHTPPKSRPGELIVCVPEELVIEIVAAPDSQSEDNLDIIIGEAREE
ncbi:MAG: NusG domain II-containing protein [Eubacteriales bacterium]|nr:NusG domain II-containing protein [Eubacteriales bacterium]